ncbi:BlaI/MecI/CopY family transcriptional regulator [Streptomyces javensis]
MGARREVRKVEKPSRPARSLTASRRRSTDGLGVDRRRGPGSGRSVAAVAAGAAVAPIRLVTGGRHELGREGAAALALPRLAAFLDRKGTLERERQGRDYAYRPIQDPHGLTALRMHGELARDSDRESALARFVAQLTPDDEQVLRRLLEEGL